MEQDTYNKVLFFINKKCDCRVQSVVLTVSPWFITQCSEVLSITLLPTTLQRENDAANN